MGMYFNFLKGSNKEKSYRPPMDWESLGLIFLLTIVLVGFIALIGLAAVGQVNNTAYADGLCVEKHGEYSRVDDLTNSMPNGVEKVKCEYVEDDTLKYACYTHIKGRLVPFDCSDPILGDDF